MINVMFGSWSVGVEFHVYRHFRFHTIRFFGVTRRALTFGAVTLDVVRAEVSA